MMILTNIFLLIILSVTPHISHAQFKKYKTSSRFKKENFQGAENFEDVNKDGAPATTDSTDIFGRGSGIKGGTNNIKSKKYVNLNPETGFGPEVITSFDFPNTTLLDLTKHMQKLTGINLILDKDIKGKVSILAPSPITVGDAWKAYLSALNMGGYTLVKTGAFYKITNARDVRFTPTKIYTGSYTPDLENYVMRIVPLKNISSNELTRNLRPFMSRYGRITDIKQTNTIIIHDTGANINRLVRLIKFLDVPGHEETLQIISVHYSSAQEIAKLLDSILRGTGSKRFRSSSSSKKKGSNISRIIAEPRTNSIIAMANAQGAKKLRKLIKKLDVKGIAAGADKVHVYYLNYGDAEMLAKTLSTLISGSTKKRKSSSRFSKRSSITTAGSELFSNQVRITADKDNNALVISASATDFLTLKKVISKLDIPRDQVYVEGLILETAVSDGSAFGISLVSAYGGSEPAATERVGFTGGSPDFINLLTNNIASLGGLFIGGGIGKKVELDMGNGSKKTVRSVNGLLTAIATSNKSNVLATPQILVLDNVEAEFVVGEQVPIPESTSTANGSTTVAVKMQTVALSLKITPQINKVTRFIKLKINQKSEDFSQREVPNTAGGVATTTRQAVTTVVVRDRDTMVMGGLMRDKIFTKINKVPLLGDIPVLGWLFKRKETASEKVNLLFFLTPKIISAYDNSAAQTMKDVLNRRSLHLKDVTGEDDKNSSTTKGLFYKAKKQEEGPLYDENASARYRNANEGPGIGNGPNYKEIEKKAKAKKAPPETEMEDTEFAPE